MNILNSLTGKFFYFCFITYKFSGFLLLFQVSVLPLPYAFNFLFLYEFR